MCMNETNLLVYTCLNPRTNYGSLRLTQIDSVTALIGVEFNVNDQKVSVYSWTYCSYASLHFMSHASPAPKQDAAQAGAPKLKTEHPAAQANDPNTQLSWQLVSLFRAETGTPEFAHSRRSFFPIETHPTNSPSCNWVPENSREHCDTLRVHSETHCGRIWDRDVLDCFVSSISLFVTIADPRYALPLYSIKAQHRIIPDTAPNTNAFLLVTYWSWFSKLVNSGVLSLLMLPVMELRSWMSSENSRSKNSGATECAVYPLKCPEYRAHKVMLVKTQNFKHCRPANLVLELWATRFAEILYVRQSITHTNKCEP